MAEIKIGDKVKIVDAGQCFSAYSDFIFHENYMKIDTDKLACWKFNRCPSETDDTEYTVVCLSPHYDTNISGGKLLAYVVNLVKQEGYIIRVDGLAKVESPEEMLRNSVIQYLKDAGTDEIRSIMKECNIQTVECLQIEDVPDGLKDEILDEWWNNASYGEMAEKCNYFGSAREIALELVENYV